jgi:hypothetical protein
MKLGIKAYARHRKDRGWPGATPAAVRKALERGQIRKTLDDLIDVAEADRNWPGDEPFEGGNLGGEPVQPVPPSAAVPPFEPARAFTAAADDSGESPYTRAKVRKETADARLRELKVLELEGTLIPFDVHEERVEDICQRLSARVKNLERYRDDVLLATTDIEAGELLERIQEELLDDLRAVADELEDLEGNDLEEAA